MKRVVRVTFDMEIEVPDCVMGPLDKQIYTCKCPSGKQSFNLGVLGAVNPILGTLYKAQLYASRIVSVETRQKTKSFLENVNMNRKFYSNSHESKTTK